MRIIFPVVAAFTCLLLRADIIDRIAVSVGNHVITTSDIEREIRVTAFLNGEKPDLSAKSRREAADRLVEQRLIRNELENSRYPQPSASEVEAPLQEFKSKYFRDDAAYTQALAEASITDQDVRDELRWQRALLLFMDVRFRPGAQVTAAEIEDYFNKVVAPAARLAHPGEAVTLDDYRGQIEEKLTGEKANQESDRWLNQARKRTEIVYHEEVFR